MTGGTGSIQHLTHFAPTDPLAEFAQHFTLKYHSEYIVKIRETGVTGNSNTTMRIVSCWRPKFPMRQLHGSPDSHRERQTDQAMRKMQ